MPKRNERCRSYGRTPERIDIEQRFRRRLVYWMDKRGLTPYRLELLTGVYYTSILTYMDGRNSPGIGIVVLLARALGITPNDFLLEIENDPSINEVQVSERCTSSQVT